MSMHPDIIHSNMEMCKDIKDVVIISVVIYSNGLQILYFCSISHPLQYDQSSSPHLFGNTTYAGAAEHGG